MGLARRSRIRPAFRNSRRSWGPARRRSLGRENIRTRGGSCSPRPARADLPGSRPGESLRRQSGEGTRGPHAVGSESKQPGRVLPHDPLDLISREHFDLLEEVERRRTPLRMGPIRSEEHVLRTDEFNECGDIILEKGRDPYVLAEDIARGSRF
jgi:hypothetical protein